MILHDKKTKNLAKSFSNERVLDSIENFKRRLRKDSNRIKDGLVWQQPVALVPYKDARFDETKNYLGTNPSYCSNEFLEHTVEEVREYLAHCLNIDKEKINKDFSNVAVYYDKSQDFGAYATEQYWANGSEDEDVKNEFKAEGWLGYNQWLTKSIVENEIRGKCTICEFEYICESILFSLSEIDTPDAEQTRRYFKII